MAIKQQITIPSDTSEIKLWQYQEFILNKDKFEDDEDALKRYIVSVFGDVDFESTFLISNNGINRCVEAVSKAVSLKKGDKHKFIPTFNIGDVGYGFIPDLEEKCAFGEYVNMDTYFGDPEGLTKFMSVCFRPLVDYDKISGKYTITPYKRDMEENQSMGMMPLNVALGALDYFHSLGIQLLSNIPSILLRQNASQISQEQVTQVEIFQRAGDGIQRSIVLHREIYDALTKYTSKTYGTH